MKDSAEILGDLGGMYSSDELSLSGACGNGHLELRFVGNGTTSKTEYNTSEGASCVGVSSIGCFDKTNKLQKGVLWE